MANLKSKTTKTLRRLWPETSDRKFIRAEAARAGFQIQAWDDVDSRDASIDRGPTREISGACGASTASR